MPPRATSKTAVSTDGFCSTICADFGPDMSPRLMSRPSMTMPSVVVMPTRRPMSLRMWAIMRTVVVLPFVPVTATIGMRAGVPGGKSRSSTGLATYCGSPPRGGGGVLDPGPVGRPGVELPALGPQQLFGGGVDLDLREHLLVADAPAGIRILDLHERADRALAIAVDAGRHALRDGGPVPADDQAAVVVAGDVALDHDVAAA